LSPGELDGCRLGERLGRDERRPEQLAPQRKQVVERPAIGVRGRATQAPGQAERAGHGVREVVRERHLRPRLEEPGGELDPGVRVDPAPARPGDRLLALERQPGGVGEQVAHRRPGWACGLVEVDRSLLECDEKREPRQELRDGGPGQVRVARTVCRDDAVGPRHSRRSDACVPAVDRAQRLHGGRV
jgi:hypothetical protein